jgi:hypothetical protein
MHTEMKCQLTTTWRPQAGLRGSFCILPVDSLPTSLYPASLGEPKFATRNQEAGT